MGPERRLHPSSFLFSMGAHVRSLLIPGALVIFTAGSSGRDWDVWLMALIIPYTVAAIIRSLSYRYRFDADEMVVRRGWIFRSERHIPYARIQNVDAVQNVLHRALGVAEVRVETASGGEPEATMTVLPVEAFAEMRRFVFSGRPAADVDDNPDEPAPITDAASPDTEVLIQLQPRELLLHGFIESRGAVLMAGGVGVLWELGLFDRFVRLATGGDLARRGVVRQLVRAAIGQDAVSVPQIAVTLGAFVALLLVLRLVSMVWAYDLRVDYGLLTRISATIPLRRIQTLTVTESPLHRWFGRVSVHVDTAGGDGGKEQPTRREPIGPIVGRDQLAALTAALLPSVSLADVNWQPPHRRAFRRALVRVSLVVALGLALMIVLLRWWTLAAAVALFAWAWIEARQYVSHLGWALAGDAVVFRSGWLWRHTTVARFSKIQVVTRLESPFDRRTGMATVKVDTAGARKAEHTIEVPFMPAEAAAALTSTLSAHAAQTAFRW
jgi:putative membrane protein